MSHLNVFVIAFGDESLPTVAGGPADARAQAAGRNGMNNTFLLKMRTLGVTADEDALFIRQLCQNHRSVPAGTDLAQQGDRPDEVWVILSGLACRYKLLTQGERQIVAFLVPGDICDLHVAMLGSMDHTIGVNVDSQVATIARDEVATIVEERPAVARALLMANLIDLAVLREWVVNNGRRDAYARIAHLLWELYLRHSAVGMVEEYQFRLPLTQRDLADATSLSHVHISRTLTRLKDEGVIEWSRKTVHILDPKALRVIAGFDPDYLHRSGVATDPGRLTGR